MDMCWASEALHQTLENGKNFPQIAVKAHLDGMAFRPLLLLVANQRLPTFLSYVVGVHELSERERHRS